MPELGHQETFQRHKPIFVLTTNKKSLKLFIVLLFPCSYTDVWRQRHKYIQDLASPIIYHHGLERHCCWRYNGCQYCCTKSALIHSDLAHAIGETAKP